jgi:hypothetical protein
VSSPEENYFFFLSLSSLLQKEIILKTETTQKEMKEWGEESPLDSTFASCKRDWKDCGESFPLFHSRYDCASLVIMSCVVKNPEPISRRQHRQAVYVTLMRTIEPKERESDKKYRD